MTGAQGPLRPELRFRARQLPSRPTAPELKFTASCPRAEVRVGPASPLQGGLRPTNRTQTTNATQVHNQCLIPSLICFSNLSIPKMKRRAYTPFQDIMGLNKYLKESDSKSCIER